MDFSAFNKDILERTDKNTLFIYCFYTAHTFELNFTVTVQKTTTAEVNMFDELLNFLICVQESCKRRVWMTKISETLKIRMLRERKAGAGSEGLEKNLLII